MKRIPYAAIDALPVHPIEKFRIKMTAACTDCESLPRVQGAGTLRSGPDGRFQLMHNGVQVVADGYIGRWVTELIKVLRGFHEPQEEWAFAQVLKHLPKNATMIELGSWWSYYSLWFQQDIQGARNYMVEPDPNNLEVGRRNFELNHRTGHFINAAIGRESLDSIQYRSYESDNVERPLPVVSVDDFIARAGISFVDLLLADIQGFELQMLQGSEKSIAAGLIRFMVVSTHHHSISNDPLMHQKCLQFLQERGAHILVEHTVSESYSGDGLIVAALRPEDRALPAIEVSRNRASSSLFRELEYDLADLVQDREKLLADLRNAASGNEQLQAELEHAAAQQERLRAELQQASTEVEGLGVDLEAASGEREQLRIRLTQALARQEQMWQQLERVHHGRSWRLTAPLRWLADAARSTRQDARRLLPITTLPRRATRKLLRLLLVWATGHPRIDRLLWTAVNYFPAIKMRLRQLAFVTDNPESYLPGDDQSAHIAPQVRAIYLDLVNGMKGRGAAGSGPTPGGQLE